MMKKSVLRVLTIVLALAMVLSCFSGCASISTKLSVNDVELDGDYLTPDDYIEEIEANAPVYEEEPEEEEPEEEEPEAEEPEGEETEGEETEGEDTEGEDTEGETAEGEDTEGEDAEGEGENNEDLFEDEGEKDYSDYLSIVSYNIKCAYYGKSWAGVIENIKSVDADIIGLQECDDGTNRSSSTPGDFSNQVQQLANDMGYKYWYFSKTIETSGGDYGHGVISRFPIEDSQTIFFKAQKDEIRNMERHVLDVDGTELIFYNTHLNGSFFDQFNEVVAAMEKDYAAGKYVLLTGDFNISYENMSGWLDADNFLPLNGNDTFSFGLKNITVIDNIIISRNITDYYMDESTQIGVKYLDAEEEDSDHPMIYSYIKLPEK